MPINLGDTQSQVNCSRSPCSGPAAAFFLLCSSRAFAPLAETVLQQVCVRAVRRRLASVCDDYIAGRIIGLLRPHEVVLTGGIIWQALVPDVWTPHGHIDLFIVYEQLEAVEEALRALGGCTEQQGPSHYILSDTQMLAPPLSVWKSAIWFVRTYAMPRGIRIDVVVVAYSISAALARLDLRACASNFDGRKVEIVDPCVTLAKKTRVCAHLLALINGFAVSVAGDASRNASCYLSRRVWFGGLGAGVEALRSLGFDPASFHELVVALRSDAITLRLCRSVCQLACFCK